MEIIKEDDPITLANYARYHELLERSVWKWAKRYIALTKTSQASLIQIYTENVQDGT